jgi:hypothetical protein
VTDEELLAPCAVEGQGAATRIPDRCRGGLHALLEGVPAAQLWNPSHYVDRSELPSSGEIHRSRDPAFDADAYDEERAERYARREGFY